jgi:hypothetical protein
LTALESNNIVTWNPRPFLSTVAKIEQKNLKVNSIDHALAEAYLWHRRAGHLNFQYLSQLSRQQIGLPKSQLQTDQNTVIVVTNARMLGVRFQN